MNIGTKFVFFLVLTLSAGYQPSAQDQRSVLSRPIEEIVVIGKRPGPSLWKVTNGDNVLWIFGVHHPVPKSLEWDSESVEWVIIAINGISNWAICEACGKKPAKSLQDFSKNEKT